MGIGPVAIPAVVKTAGLELDDIDLFEINEVIIELGLSEADSCWISDYIDDILVYMTCN